MANENPIPAFCSHCGLVFPARGIAIVGGATNLTLRGNIETCPRCGQWAELPEGTFNISDNTLEVLSASDLTRERLHGLAEALDRARKNPKADASESLERESPAVAALYRGLSPKARHALILFLWAVVQIIASTELGHLTSDSATTEELRQDVATLQAGQNNNEQITKAAIQQAVERALQDYSKQPRLDVVSKSRRRDRAKPRAKRPSKTHGKKKKRRR